MTDTTKSPTGQQVHGQHLPEGSEISERTAAILTARLPRLFAVVIEPDDDIDAEVIGWGMALDDDAHMVSADGRNYYALADAENALNYVRSAPNVVPHLVWFAPGALTSPE
ncbi:hypothetical protein [Kibdelosporangium aridum]|uniref:hypothetical protein n=1 Tax=Kibdelosporangium aridum TaxID=2030 RepID=UPI0035ED4DF6